MSVREAGRAPGIEANTFYHYGPTYSARHETFLLMVAIFNRDLDTLLELWSHYMAWDYCHITTGVLNHI